MSARLDELLDRELGHRRAMGQLRIRTAVERVDANHLTVGGRSYINFASNDYLGLSGHPGVLAAAREALERGGAGAGASGLVTGYLSMHEEAEKALAGWKGTAGAVLMPSGYQTAQGVIQTLTATGPVRFLVDKLCHASLIDAVTGSGKTYRIFPHNHLGKLERLLGEAAGDELQVVVTESIFSMDGDAGDLPGLAKLKKKFPFVLVLDEAHGSGVYGEAGAGLSAEMGLSGMVDVTIMTLSKAMGLMGGAACGSRMFCEGMVNFARAYIYSTQISQVIAGGVPSALKVMRNEPERQRRVRALAKRVREELREGGVAVAEGDSPIVPIILREEKRAVEAAQKLREKGLWVVPIRPPTVARGTSRLRVTLSAAHADEDVERLIGALRDNAIG